MDKTIKLFFGAFPFLEMGSLSAFGDLGVKRERRRCKLQTSWFNGWNVGERGESCSAPAMVFFGRSGGV